MRLSSRTSAASAEAIQACRDSIATTTVDLEAHLEDIQQKLETLTQRTTAGPNTDTAVRHHMEEERLSTQKALQFCALISQQIEHTQVEFLGGDHGPPGSPDPSSTSKMLLGEGLEGFMHHMRFTLGNLEKHHNRVAERLGTSPTATVSAQDQASLDTLRSEAKTLRRCLEFCSDVDAYLESQMSNIENHVEGDDTIQLMVSTNGKPLKGKNRGIGQRLKQAGGHLDDASLQQVSKDFKSTALHQTELGGQDANRSASIPGDDSTSAEPVPPFGDRHGLGYILTKRSVSSAPPGPTG